MAYCTVVMVEARQYRLYLVITAVVVPFSHEASYMIILFLDSAVGYLYLRMSFFTIDKVVTWSYRQ